ncbi:hypothetical protein BJV78DRAFT_1378383 [Lactifluus subvellereus]|nr:hypothetical protein BJV78DRAFT_1378383 [Lactifluus subvellereus]
MFMRRLTPTPISCCLSRSRTYTTGHNKVIIDLLTRCLKEEDSSPTRNAYKIRSFQVAIAAVHEHDKPIRSGKEAIKLRGIGLGIANRIDFFLQGKEYDEGVEKQARARLLAVETFQKIPGIGERTATNLVNAGATSISDLRLPEYATLLTPAQKVGVLYGDHMTRAMPRAEAEDIAAFIRDHISRNFEVHLTGAYRREAADLPVVTILLHHHQHIHVPVPPPPPLSSPSTSTTASGKMPVRTRGRQHVPFLQVNTSAAQHSASPLLQDVVRPLEAACLLAATLAAGPRKWRGVALLPLRADADLNVGPSSGTWQEVGYRMRDLRAGRGKYVRLDLSLAPLKSRGAAQIVLTGDEEFVRIARLAAARHGMYLDEYGLWRWHSSEEAALESQSNADADADAERRQNAVGSAVAGYWELVEGESEDRILDELELGSIAPYRRNFRFLTSKKRASARAGTFNLSWATLADDVDSDVLTARRGRQTEGVNEDGDAAVEGVDQTT